MTNNFFSMYDFLRDNPRATGNKIKELRKRYNLSRPALANELGVHKQYVYMLEKGIKPMSMKMLGKLLNKFQIEITDLML